mmetsp:Transcript_122409/g.391366  ORF Transcript_122409/g.391366 Transcript_122409/m.391366 type:complete len:421 (+) Transcript_122409:2-1264(+)
MFQLYDALPSLTTDSNDEISVQAWTMTLDLFNSASGKFKDEFGAGRRIRTSIVLPASESGLPSAQDEDSECVAGRLQCMPNDAPKTTTSFDLSFSQPRSTADVERWLNETAAKRPLRSNLNGQKRESDRPGLDLANGELFKDELGVAKQIRTKTVLPPSAQMRAIGSPRDTSKPRTSFDLSFSQPRPRANAGPWLDVLATERPLRANLGQVNDSERMAGQPQYVPEDTPKLPASFDLSFAQPRSEADIEQWLDELAAEHREIYRPVDDLIFKDELDVARQVRTNTVPPESVSRWPSSSRQMQAIGSSIHVRVSSRMENEDSELLSGRPQYSPMDAPKLPTSFDLSFAQPRSEADVERWLDDLAANKRKIDRPAEDVDKANYSSRASSACRHCQGSAQAATPATTTHTKSPYACARSILKA